MKHENATIKRLLSLLLALMMVFSILPRLTLGAHAATPDVLYLKPNSNWTQGNARFAAYFFGNSGSVWVSMTDSDGDDIYEVEVPDGYPSVIFCRMNPGTTANNWDNKWDQTVDLTVPTDGNNQYTVKDGTWNQGGGTWSTYVAPTVPIEHTYTVAGDSAALFGTAWDVANTDNDMTEQDDGTYVKVYEDVAAGTYKFKVARDHDWAYSWGGTADTNGNAAVTVDTDGSTVTITFDAATGTVAATVEAPAAPTPTYTITWLVDGEEYAKTEGLTEGDAITAPADPTKAAVDCTTYAFANWDPEIPATMPAEDLIFNAVFTETTAHTLSYTDNKDGTHSASCACGDTTVTSQPHNYVDGFCDACGAAEPVENITVYAINSKEWAQVYAYVFDAGGSFAQPWPGTQMTLTDETVHGFEVYSFTFSDAYINLIFTDNTGSQTADLTIQAGQYYDLKTDTWYASLEDVPFVDPLVTDVYLVGEFNGWSTTSHAFKKAALTDTVATMTMTLEAATAYQFKIVNEGRWTSSETAINGDVSGLVFSDSVGINTTITTVAAGKYVFAFDLTTQELSVTYPQAGCEHPAHSQDGICSECGESVEHVYNEHTGMCSCGAAEEWTTLTLDVTAVTETYDYTVYAGVGATYFYFAFTDEDGDGIYTCQVPSVFYQDAQFVLVNGEDNMAWLSRSTFGANANGSYLRATGEYDEHDYLVLVNTPAGEEPACEHPAHSQDGICSECGESVEHVYNEYSGMCSCGAAEEWTTLTLDVTAVTETYDYTAYGGIGETDFYFAFTDEDGDGIYTCQVPSVFYQGAQFKLVNGEDYYGTLSRSAFGANANGSYLRATGEYDEYDYLVLVNTPAEEPEPEDLTVYFINSGKWSTVNAYVWADASYAPWPGTAMEKTSDTVNGHEIYTFTFPETYVNVIFNNGSGQTPDLTVQADQYYDLTTATWYASLDDYLAAVEPDAPVQTMTIYFQNNWLWTDVSIYYWGSSAENPVWHGYVMDYYGNDGNYDIYVYEVPVDVDGFIINGIMDDGSGNRDETPTIAEGAEDGICYYMMWNNGNLVGSEPIDVILPPVEPEVIEIEKMRAELNNSLQADFAFLSNLRDDWTGCYAVITQDCQSGTRTTTVPFENWGADGDYLVIPYAGLAAKEMVDDLTLTIYDADNNVISEPYTSSMADYAVRAFDHTDSDVAKAMYVEMLYYGAAAQAEFGYKTETPATDKLTDDMLAISRSDVQLPADCAATDTLNYLSSRLQLENNIKLDMKFSVAYSDLYVVVVTCGGEELEASIASADDGANMIVTVKSLVIADCGKDVTIEVYEGETLIASATDSVAKWSARTQTQQTLAQAIMNFSESTVAYLQSK